MEMKKLTTRYYLCIDLRTFYASVESVERGLDPMVTKLVVADPDRSGGTVCLAVTTAMKKLCVKNRCRVREIPKNIEYIMAEPRMKLYIDYAAEIYGIYLKNISKDDIFVYSVDEAFLDVTNYLSLYQMTPKELGQKLMDEIYNELGLRSACGIGTNLYLTKVALDITAKHSPDSIGFLDEETYRKTLWNHRPITDFWRIGEGTARRLARLGIYTMEGIAKANEDLLYKVFGVDAELLIDHANGLETTTIADIKAYRPKTKSFTSGQVLPEDYTFSDSEIVVKEMMDELCFQMVEKGYVTKSVTLHVGYSYKANLEPAHGTFSVDSETNAPAVLIPEIAKLYRDIVDFRYPIRRIHIYCNNVVREDHRQMSFFDNNEKIEKSTTIQKTMLDIKKKYGKNAVFKGIDLHDSATTRQRNRQIGGHKSGE